MPVERLCKGGCGKLIQVYNSTQTRCRDCTLKNAKPIPQRGKQARMWETFRDKVAIPYLDKKFGHVCSVKGCNETQHLDVDHKITRGARHDLKFDVKNMRFLCRAHHRAVTDGKLQLNNAGAQS